MIISLKTNNPELIPVKATKGSAGFDLKADIERSIKLQPMERVLVPTGIYLELPEGYEAQIRPRSGLAVKQGITVLNTPGTIDSDYRGEIKVLLINMSSEEQVVPAKARIAQMVIARVEEVEFTLKDNLTNTGRDEGGFGSTGIK